MSQDVTVGEISGLQADGVRVGRDADHRNARLAQLANQTPVRSASRYPAHNRAEGTVCHSWREATTGRAGERRDIVRNRKSRRM